MNNSYKLVMFDMDGTLLDGKSIFVFAEKKGFLDKLINEFKSQKEPYKKSLKIASFLKGVDYRELIDVVRTIPFQKNVKKIVKLIQEKNIKIALSTDSYQFIANDLKNRLKLDYAFANNLIIEKNIIAGKIIINNFKMERCIDNKIYSICKGKILEKLCIELKIKPSEVIAVGDGTIDIGMLRKAGLGIAYKASENVQKNADISSDRLDIIEKYI